jgi:hypothetical protein
MWIDGCLGIDCVCRLEVNSAHHRVCLMPLWCLICCDKLLILDATLQFDAWG